MAKFLERILIVEKDKEFCEILENSLAVENFRAESVYTAEDAFIRLTDREYGIVVLTLNLPDISGMQLLTRIKEMKPNLQVIVISETGSVGAAVEALKAGAFDVINKPILIDDIVISIRKAFHTKERLQDAGYADGDDLRPLIGSGRKMHEMHELIKKVAPADSTVLIIGESGTGKELVAHSIFKNSLRKDKPFVKISCAALPETLLESELFGYVKGAFTGATQSKKGLFEVAHGGTLFLDEIGEVPSRIQAKLLRALQEREIKPVGGTQDIPVDVRFIAATNRDLHAEIENGNFREDLFYRLNVINLHVPALRERTEDIPDLVNFFIKKYSSKELDKLKSVDPEVLSCFVRYGWSGNIRELENVIERAIILGTSESITLNDIPKRIQNPESQITGSILDRLSHEDGVIPLDEAVDAIERDLIMRAMRKAKGVVSRAAKMLAVKRTTLIAKMKKLGLK